MDTGVYDGDRLLYFCFGSTLILLIFQDCHPETDLENCALTFMKEEAELYVCHNLILSKERLINFLE